MITINGITLNAKQVEDIITNAKSVVADGDPFWQCELAVSLQDAGLIDQATFDAYVD